MRIATVRTNTSKRSYSLDEIDKLNNKVECPNCHHKRVILCRINNPMMIMRSCVNKKCFLYVDINKIKTWIIKGENK